MRERPLKLQRCLVQMLAIWKQIAKAGMKIHHAVEVGGILVSAFSKARLSFPLLCRATNFCKIHLTE
jgi:hypothetical protein